MRQTFSLHDLTIGLTVLGLTAAAAAIYGAAVDPEVFHRHWLIATLFWLALPVGAMPIIAAHALTGGEWGRHVVPVAQAVIATLPVPLAAFAVPLLFGMPSLFEWLAPAESLPEVVRKKLLYLNAPFFTARSLVAFAVLLLLAALLGAWRGRRGVRPAAGAATGVFWVLATTVLSFDWLMSLAPSWYSDVFGLMVAAGWIVPGMALVILLAGPLEGDGEAAQARRTDVANLWIAAILLWVFLAFAQYLIIWMGNLPHEAEWYLHRGHGAWRIVSVATLAAMAVIPFVAMLPGGVRRSRTAMAWLAGVALLGHALQTYWLVMPTFRHLEVPLHWLLPATWIAIGAPWALFLLWTIRTDRVAAAGGQEGAHG